MPGGRAHTTTLEHGITAVDTEYDRPLHDASHLINEGGKAAFVDTGVNDSEADAFGQILDRSHQGQGGGADVAPLGVVTNVDDPRVGRELGEHSVDNTNELVLESEVRQEADR